MSDSNKYIVTFNFSEGMANATLDALDDHIAYLTELEREYINSDDFTDYERLLKNDNMLGVVKTWRIDFENALRIDGYTPRV